MKPEFRAALTMASLGTFMFVGGVATSGAHRTVGLAAAATGVLLLAVAFPRLWLALPGLPTGRIEPAITNPGRAAPPAPPAAGPAVALFAGPAATPAPTVPGGIDPVTGELVGDRVARLESDVAELSRLFSEQAELVAASYAALRAEMKGS